MAQVNPCPRCNRPLDGYSALGVDARGTIHLLCVTEEESYRDNGGWRERQRYGPKPALVCECPYEGKPERRCPVHPDLYNGDDNDDEGEDE